MMRFWTHCLALACFAAGPAVAASPQVEELAWELHDQEITGASLIARAGDGPVDPALLAAAARALEPAQLTELARHALAQLDPQAEAPGRGWEEFLTTVALQAEDRPRLRTLREVPAWRELATVALLQTGGGPEELDGFDSLLASALTVGWRPTPETWPAFLAEQRLRAQLWPACIGVAISQEEAQAIAAVKTDGWPAGDVLLRDLLVADAQAPNAASAARLWQGWLEVPLPQQAGVALQEALARHLPAAAEALFAATLDAESLPASRRVDALELLARLAPPPAASLLRRTALEDGDSMLRARAAQAVLRCGSDVDVQALAALLTPSTPQPILQTLLAGMRLRPAAEIGGTLEAMMPRLRTRAAAAAVELIVLTGDRDQRLAWLDRLDALPTNDQLRIVQGAWAVDPSDALLAWLEGQASTPEASASARGRVGLQLARTPDEVADFYASLINRVTDPEHRQALLAEVRELRTDPALEVLVDWLATAEGRVHPRSVEWAALVLEEARAQDMFAAWWTQHRATLNPTQQALAATALVDQDPEARAFVREAIPQTEPGLRARMLDALGANPQADDLAIAERVFVDGQQPDPIRGRAGELLGRLAGGDAALRTRFLALLVESAASAAEGAAPSRAWRGFLRRLGEGLIGQADAREALLQQLASLPAAWRSVLILDQAIGESLAPDEGTLPRALGEFMLGLTATAGEAARDAREAEQRLRLEQPAFLAALLLLNAQADEVDLDALLEREGRLPAPWNPDALAHAARALAAGAPDFADQARHRLRVTESRGSWRRPPEENTLGSTHPWLLDTAAGFVLVQQRWADPEASAEDLLDLLQARAPRDRRVHLWRGWYAWRAQDWELAEASFTLAATCSGWLPYARMEPRLGLSLCAWSRDASIAPLEALSRQLPQSLDLLAARVPAELTERLLAALADQGEDQDQGTDSGKTRD